MSSDSLLAGMDKLRIGTERLFLRSPNINVCFRIRIDGEFDSEYFSRAIDNVSKRHPLISCSIETDSDRKAYFVPNANPLKAVYYSRAEMPDWKDWYEKTDNIPFDFAHGPLLKICAIAGDGQTELIILGHHIIGDGTGYLNLAKDILLALDGRLEIIPQIPPDNDAFLKGKRISFLSRLYSKKLNKAWRKSGAYISEKDYLDFFRSYRKRFVPKIYLEPINEKGLERLIAICKSNGVSVNELMTSAFAVAFAGDTSVRTGVAASTRGELTTKPDHCMGNYVTGVSIKADCSSGRLDFPAQLKNIATLLRNDLGNANKKHAIVNFLRGFEGDMIESIMFASYGNYPLPVSQKIGRIIAEGLEGRGLGVSNLARYEMKDYKRFALLDLQFIGPAFPANIISVSIITVNNKLNICLRYNETDIETSAVVMVHKKAMGLIFNDSNVD